MASSAKSAAAAAAPRATTLLVATRKGLWTLSSDAARRKWKLAGPDFLGHIVHHAIKDPRDGKTLLAAARTGHLGPTVFRSTDRGRTWKEARAPARVQGGQRTHRRSHVLAHPRPPDATRRLVCRHIAAGLVPIGRRRRDVVRGRRVQRSSATQGLVRRRSGRYARRPQDALDPDRPARSEAHVHRDVEWRRVRILRQRRRLETA